MRTRPIRLRMGAFHMLHQLMFSYEYSFARSTGKLTIAIGAIFLRQWTFKLCMRVNLFVVTAEVVMSGEKLVAVELKTVVWFVGVSGNDVGVEERLSSKT